MAHVYERTDSGLLVARDGADGAAVARSLKDHDPDLRLVPQFSETYGGTYWSVYRYAGSERPAGLVCAWVDYDRHEAKPLSMALVDRVKELDRNTRGETVDPDTANAELRDANKRHQEQERQDLIDDWVAHGKRSHLLPRSQSLRQARSRTGYHDKKGR